MYVNLADHRLPALDNSTQSEALTTLEGLEVVNFLLHTYEHGEIQQAREQHRSSVSFDFLKHESG